MNLFKKKTSPPPTKTVQVHMADGTIQDYPEHFMITDKINCVICNSALYHTSLDCECLRWEMQNSSEPLNGMTIKDAKAMKKTFCQECSRVDYNFRHGRPLEY